MSIVADNLQATDAELQAVAEEVKAEAEAIDIGQLAEDMHHAQVLRYLRRRGQLLAEIEHTRQQTDAFLRSLISKLNGLDCVYGSHAKEWTRRQLAGRKSKSIRTPFGVAGFRSKPAGVEIENPSTVIELVQTGALPRALIRQRTEVAKDALNEHVKATGEIPAGCKAVPAEEVFYVR